MPCDLWDLSSPSVLNHQGRLSRVLLIDFSFLIDWLHHAKSDKSAEKHPELSQKNNDKKKVLELDSDDGLYNSAYSKNYKIVKFYGM